MQCLRRISSSSSSCLYNLPSISAFISLRNSRTKFTSPSESKNGDDEWNEAWESSWVPEDFMAKNRAPWESDVNFSQKTTSPSDLDSETKAFVEEMNENWNERRGSKNHSKVSGNGHSFSGGVPAERGSSGLYNAENLQKDYRVKKQKIHAGLWLKEIEKEKEAKLGNSNGDDIEKLLDSCSEKEDTRSAFDKERDDDLSCPLPVDSSARSNLQSGNNGFNDSKIPSTSEFKTKPDGWETTSKEQDGKLWEISQREEDILMQEFERRIAYSKFQISSFIKSHIFSRRRPIDGWKYMIEELGPNARKGKGSVTRLPSISDSSNQPFKEEKMPIRSSNLTPYKGR